jgi:hypothetical protein
MLVVVLERLLKPVLEQTVLHTLKLYTSVAWLQHARNGRIGLAVLEHNLGLEPATMQTVMQPQKHKVGVLHSVEVGEMLELVKMLDNPEKEPV